MTTEFLRHLLQNLLSENLTFSLVLISAALFAPTLYAMYNRYYLIYKIESIYKQLLQAKDEVIERKDDEIQHLRSLLQNPPERPKKEPKNRTPTL